MEKKQSVEILVQNDVGFHARPATVFVETALQFEAGIEVSYRGQRANGKSLLGLLGLGIDQGARITIEAQGDDADEALDDLTELIKSDFITPNLHKRNGTEEQL